MTKMSSSLRTLQRMIQYQSMHVAMCCLNPPCVWYHGQYAHYTWLYVQNVIFYNFATHFTLKNVRKFQIHLDRWVLTSVTLCPIKSKMNSPLKLANYFSSKTLSFPQFSMAVACCYNSWDLNISSLRNAWLAGFETSSEYIQCYCLIRRQIQLATTWCIFIDKNIGC